MEKDADKDRPNTKPTLLVVEDDEATRAQLQWALGDEYDLCVAGDRHSAVEAFRRMRPDVSLLDLRLPPHTDVPSEGLAVLATILKLDHRARVIVLSGQTDQETTRKALSQGACDFLCKPAQIDELRRVLRCRSQRTSPGGECPPPGQSVADPLPEALQGRSPRMREVLDNIRKVATTDAPVLILGETGTGKETAARAIHRLNSHKHGSFVAINCGSLWEDQVGGELFGAGTGAVSDADPGQSSGIALASGGTLFLDGVDRLPFGKQARLLKVFQDRVIDRIGEGNRRVFDARVIAATSADLPNAAKGGRFLEDLYYRLAVVVIRMPALRERPEDIRPLAKALLRRFADQHRKPALTFELDALRALERHPWPGNLRELENCLRRAVILSDGERLRAEHLGLAPLPARSSASHGLKNARQAAEHDMIVQALQKHGGKVAPAALELGISRPTLYALMRKLNIDRWSLQPPHIPPNERQKPATGKGGTQ